MGREKKKGCHRDGRDELHVLRAYHTSELAVLVYLNRC